MARKKSADGGDGHGGRCRRQRTHRSIRSNRRRRRDEARHRGGDDRFPLRRREDRPEFDPLGSAEGEGPKPKRQPGIKMNNGELMLGGLKLMVFGMGMVFCFLALMIGAMHLLAKLTARFRTETAPTPAGSADLHLAAAAVAAVKLFQ